MSAVSRMKLAVTAAYRVQYRAVHRSINQWIY